MARDQTNTGPWLHEVIGENLRQWRESKGHRQDDVAARARSVGLAWTQATVAQIETGRRETLERLSEMVLVSEFTGLSIAELVDSDSPVWLAPGVGAPMPSADADAKWLMAKLGGERIDRGLRTPADHIAGGLGFLESQWPGAPKWKLAQVSMDSQRTAEQRVAAAFDRDKPDAVIHLAAQASVSQSQSAPALTHRVNYLGTLSVLRAALHCESQPRLLLIRSRRSTASP